MQDMKEKFNEDIEILKQNQLEILKIIISVNQEKKNL
jgi:hypothetical protein